MINHSLIYYQLNLEKLLDDNMVVCECGKMTKHYSSTSMPVGELYETKRYYVCLSCNSVYVETLEKATINEINHSKIVSVEKYEEPKKNNVCNLDLWL